MGFVIETPRTRLLYKFMSKLNEYYEDIPRREKTLKEINKIVKKLQIPTITVENTKDYLIKNAPIAWIEEEEKCFQCNGTGKIKIKRAIYPNGV